MILSKFRKIFFAVVFSILLAAGTSVVYANTDTDEQLNTEPENCNLKINFNELTLNSIEIKNQDNETIALKDETSDFVEFNLPKGTNYKAVLKQGDNGYYTYNDVNCSAENALLDKSNLVIDFQGIKNINRIEILKKGNRVAYKDYQSDTSNFTLPNGKYDINLKKGGSSYSVNNFVVLGDSVILDDIVSKLEVKFDGIENVNRIEVLKNGSRVSYKDYVSNSASFTLFKSSLPYKIKLTKGGMVFETEIVCNEDEETLVVPVTQMTVDFNGVNYVNRVEVLQEGSRVSYKDYQSNNTSFNVFKNSLPYKIKLKKGGMEYETEIVCNEDEETLIIPVTKMTVNFDGINYVNRVEVLQEGSRVSYKDYQSNNTSFNVFKNSLPYKIKLKKGGMEYETEIVCNEDEETLIIPVTKMTVNFDGINYVNRVEVLQEGSRVSYKDYQSNNTSFNVFKNNLPYKIKLKKGGMEYETEIVCNEDEEILIIPVTKMTVNFDGINYVNRVEVLQEGSRVSYKDYQSNNTSFNVFKNSLPYKIKLKKGGMEYETEIVCNEDEETLIIPVTTLSLNFNGLRNINRIEVVQNNNRVSYKDYQSNTTNFKLFKNNNPYKIKITKNGRVYGFDVICDLENVQKNIGILRLLDSTGNGISDGVAQYYQDGWKSISDTTNDYGELLYVLNGSNNKIKFRIDYNHGRDEKWQNINENCIVIFETKNVEIQLKNSNGDLIINSSGNVKYYFESWHTFGDGTTNNGVVNMELLPGNYKFMMDYNNGRDSKWQIITDDPKVIFETKNVEVQLKNSNGDLITNSSGNVKYYFESWHTFGNGTTNNGVVNMELLPGNYKFMMDYNNGRDSKWQIITDDPKVIFETKDVEVQLKNSNGDLITDSSGEVKYYFESWNTFGNGTTNNGVVKMELLPGKYKFMMDYNNGRDAKWQTITSDSKVIFETKDVEVQLKNSNGDLITDVSGEVKYYFESWNTFGNGTTNNGVVKMELLPGKYKFMMDYNNGRDAKWQTITSDSKVIFETKDVEVQLKNSNGDLITDVSGEVKYYFESWNTFGNGTLDNGVVNMELLPGNYKFRINYNNGSDEKWQLITNSDTILFIYH